MIQRYGGKIEFRSDYESVPAIGGPIDPDSVLVVFQAPDEPDNLEQYPGAKQFAASTDVKQEKWKLWGKAAGGYIIGRILYRPTQRTAP